MKNWLNFIKKRANEKLVELGYVDLGNYFPYDKNAASNLDWFYHLTGGVTHTDFFAIRPTDYSKAGEGEDFITRKLAKGKTSKTFGKVITEEEIYEQLYK